MQRTNSGIAGVAKDITPSLEHYFRIDEKFLSKHPELVKGNAFHDTLSGESKIEKYEIYQKKEGNEIACVIQIGDKLNGGHPGTVHGGIIGSAFDNSFGWLFLTLGVPPAFIANLNINFRAPVLSNSTSLLRAKISETKVNHSR